MKVLLAAAEAVPYYKTGGLGDVARALPDALRELGHDVRIIHPAYAHLGARVPELTLERTLRLPWPGGARNAAFHLDQPSDAAAAVLVRAPELFETFGPYEVPFGDGLAPGRRFAFFARAITAYARAWGADVLHLNDWQTGLAPVYALIDDLDVPTVFAIHNLAYQGNFDRALLPQIGVPPELYRTENGVEFHSQVSFMKAAIALADRLVTVSPTYAQEIQTDVFGAGLDGLLRFRRRDLTGILNGINTHVWDPARDEHLPHAFGPSSLARKDELRAALLAELELDDGGPVVAMVTRLAHQKGVDLVLEALDAFVARGVRLIVLGDGDPMIESALAAAERHHPRQVAAFFRFDDALAHRIYAGADFFLMPSRYEPCGLGQMIAQRYGAPPIARRTGGLEDTIVDGRTGFLFDDPTARSMLAAVERAVKVWRRRGWDALRRRCMKLDHSWSGSAQAYAALYEHTRGAHRR